MFPSPFLYSTGNITAYESIMGWCVFVALLQNLAQNWNFFKFSRPKLPVTLGSVSVHRSYLEKLKCVRHTVELCDGYQFLLFPFQILGLWFSLLLVLLLYVALKVLLTL